jgi:Zn-dependent M16 (insulinase) family peptidase
MLRYLLDINDEDRQKYRDELLSTSKTNFVNFAKVLEKFNDQSNLVVLGSSDAIEKTQQNNKLFTEIRKII